jgi:hypothetical protein
MARAGPLAGVVSCVAAHDVAGLAQAARAARLSHPAARLARLQCASAAAAVEEEEDKGGGGEELRRVCGAARACLARAAAAAGAASRPLPSAEAAAEAAWPTAGSPDALCVRTATEVLLLLRNLCVEERLRAALPRELGAELWRTLGLLAGLLGGEGEALGSAWREDVRALGRAAAQTLGNMCVQSPVSQAELWAMPGRSAALQEALRVAACALPADPALMGATAQLVLTLTANSAARAEEAAQDAPLVRAVLLCGAYCIAALSADADSHAASGGGGGGHDAAVADAHASCLWLVGRLADCGHGPLLLRAATAEQEGATLDKALLSLWLGFRLEQQEEHAATEARGAPSGSGSGSDDDGECPPPAPPRDDCEVEHSFAALAAELLGSDNSRERENALVRLIASYAIDPRVYHAEPCKAALLEGLLTRLGAITERQRAAAAGAASTRTAAAKPAPVTTEQQQLLQQQLQDQQHRAEDNEEEAFGQRVELIRAVTNLCFGRQVNQDAVRNTPQGLFTVLNQSHGGDERNPFLREWAILAIRAVTENNLENQRIIAELRVQGTVDSPVIAKAGLKVELTEDGQARLVNKDP